MSYDHLIINKSDANTQYDDTQGYSNRNTNIKFSEDYASLYTGLSMVLVYILLCVV